MTTHLPPSLPTLILGSSSRYRRELLERLCIPFTIDSPDIDEAALPDEAPIALCQRLSLAKAQAVAARHPSGWVIGSDQVAVLGQTIYGKPGTHAKAKRMLKELSGNTLQFHTALCLLNAQTDDVQMDVVTIEAQFRHLNNAEIEHYLEVEQPYDCAGSAKSEGLGITLLERMTGNDPSALVGLPLISLTRMLRNWGLTLPLSSQLKS